MYWSAVSTYKSSLEIYHYFAFLEMKSLPNSTLLFWYIWKLFPLDLYIFEEDIFLKKFLNKISILRATNPPMKLGMNSILIQKKMLISQHQLSLSAMPRPILKRKKRKR